MTTRRHGPSALVPCCGMATTSLSRGAVAMNIIAVVAQKGGVGKTTLSQCLAVEALRQGMAAAIIDTDPQKSTAEWGSQREAGRSTLRRFCRWDRALSAK